MFPIGPRCQLHIFNGLTENFGANSPTPQNFLGLSPANAVLDRVYFFLLYFFILFFSSIFLIHSPPPPPPPPLSLPKGVETSPGRRQQLPLPARRLPSLAVRRRTFSPNACRPQRDRQPGSLKPGAAEVSEFPRAWPFSSLLLRVWVGEPTAPPWNDYSRDH